MTLFYPEIEYFGDLLMTQQYIEENTRFKVIIDMQIHFSV
jgi:hypothetical protein